MPDEESISPCISEEEAMVAAVEAWASAREDCINAAEDVLLAIGAVGIACASGNIPACGVAVTYMLEMNDRLEEKVDELHSAREDMDTAVEEFLECADQHKEYYESNYGHIEID